MTAARPPITNAYELAIAQDRYDRLVAIADMMAAHQRLDGPATDRIAEYRQVAALIAADIAAYQGTAPEAASLNNKKYEPKLEKP